MEQNKFFMNAIVLSLPGLLSIIFSFVSIPVHLKIAGIESYGNYIIFHFLLTMSVLLNLGIGKSIVISMNNNAFKNKLIAYQGLRYTFFLSIIISLIIMLIYSTNAEIFKNFLKSNKGIYFFTICLITTIFYISLEGILQGNEKFKSLSFCNFLFFSLSLTLPSLSLMFYSSASNLDNLLLITTVLKILTIFVMLGLLIFYDLLKISSDNTLIKNLKKNSQWLTLNGILYQFYDVFDKYLVKIFMGPTALAIYSIPQQLTGKLSIFSKGFSAILLTILSKNKTDKGNFNHSIKIFLEFSPALIFLIFPLYEILLNFWLGTEFNKDILYLSKIFSIAGIFACSSHILITKFEASQVLKYNLKLEFFAMPIFLLSLYLIISEKYSLIYVASIILAKETVLLFIRLHFCKKEIKNIINYYFYIIFSILTLYLSFVNLILFCIFEILLIINILRNAR